MARKKDFNASAEIRKLWEKLGKDASGEEIRAAFQKEHPGHDIQTSLIYAAKTKVFGKSGSGRGRKPGATTARPVPTPVSNQVDEQESLASDLATLSELVREHGREGVERVFQLYTNVKGGQA